MKHFKPGTLKSKNNQLAEPWRGNKAIQPRCCRVKVEGCKKKRLIIDKSIFLTRNQSTI